MSKNKLVIDFNLDEIPGLTDALRTKLIEAVGGLVRSDIEAQLNGIIKSKLNDAGIENRVKGHIDTHMSNIFKPYNNYNSYEMSKFISGTALNLAEQKVKDYIESPEFQKSLREQVDRIVSGNISKFIKSAIKESLGEN